MRLVNCHPTDKIYGGEHPIELGDAVAGCAYLSVNSSLSMLTDTIIRLFGMKTVFCGLR